MQWSRFYSIELHIWQVKDTPVVRSYLRLVVFIFFFFINHFADEISNNDLLIREMYIIHILGIPSCHSDECYFPSWVCGAWITVIPEIFRVMKFLDMMYLYARRTRRCHKIYYISLNLITKSIDSINTAAYIHSKSHSGSQSVKPAELKCCLL